MGNMRIVLIAFLMLLFFSITLFSYWPFPSSRSSVVDGSLVTIYGLGLLIAISIIALSYTIGFAFNLKGALAFGKEELIYFVYTIFIFVALAGIDSLLSAFMNSFTRYPDVYIPASAYLAHFQSKLLKMYIHFELIEFAIGFLSGLNFGVAYLSFMNANYLLDCVDPGFIELIGLTGDQFTDIIETVTGKKMLVDSISNKQVEVSLSAAPAAGLAIISSLHTLYVDTIGYAYAIIVILDNLLEFVRQTAWPIFIPLSLFFLVFPVLRRVGATILAMTVVMYYVYPLTLLLGYEMYLRIETVVESQEESAKGSSGIEAELPQFISGMTFEQKEFVKSYDPDVMTALDDPDVKERFKRLFGAEEFQVPGSTNAEIHTKKISWTQSFVNMLGSVFSPVGVALGVFKDLIFIVFRLMFMTVQSYDIYNIFTIQIFHQLSIESLYMMYAFLQPVLTIIIIITAYRDISPVLGGEVDLFGLAEKL